jgi:hypothetical protein
MSVIGTGLTCKNVVIEIGGKVVERNNFYEGETVFISFNNFEGLKEVNKKKHPNLSVNIKDSKGKVIESGKDLLKDKTFNFSPLKLSAFFSLKFNYNEGETYQLSIKIEDKKGSGVLTAEMPFTVAPNPNMRIKKQGLTAKWAYMWDKDNDLVYTSNEIEKNHTYYIIIDSLQGLNIIDGFIHPIIPMEIIDNNGDTLLSEQNLFSMTDVGVNPEQLYNLPLRFSLNGDVANPVQVKTGVWDKESDNFMEIITTIKAK